MTHLDQGATRAGAYPVRRPLNGHHADCPYPATDPRHCVVCQGIRKGRPDDPASPAAQALGHAQPGDPTPAAELRACTRCYRPTDHPSGHCDRCQNTA